MSGSICTMKVTLRDVKPPVWRRIAVPDRITIYGLHKVLQDVMGWTNSHLHAFIAGNRKFSVPDSDSPEGEIDERKHLLRELVNGGVKKFVYEYDFGDDWLHDVVIESIGPAEPDVTYPRCIEGIGACPPEDCGGPGGYEDLLDALKNPENNEELYEWAGDWKPKPFDVDAANGRLARSRRPRRGH